MNPIIKPIYSGFDLLVFVLKIEAHSQDVRRAGLYFRYQINALTEAQLTQYFSQLLNTHSRGTLKHDLYGIKFYYDKVLRQDRPAPNLMKAPHS